MIWICARDQESEKKFVHKKKIWERSNLDEIGKKVTFGTTYETFFFDKNIFNFYIIGKDVHLEDCFNLPLEQQAYIQFLQLQSELDGLELTTQRGDFFWLDRGVTLGLLFGIPKLILLISSIYRSNFLGIYVPGPFLWIWKTKCVKKIKVLMCLLLWDRLNIRNMLDRRHCAPKDIVLNCGICGGPKKHWFIYFSLALSVRVAGNVWESNGTQRWKSLKCWCLL